MWTHWALIDLVCMCVWAGCGCAREHNFSHAETNSKIIHFWLRCECVCVTESMFCCAFLKTIVARAPRNYRATYNTNRNTGNWVSSRYKRLDINSFCTPFFRCCCCNFQNETISWKIASNLRNSCRLNVTYLSFSVSLCLSVSSENYNVSNRWAKQFFTISASKPAIRACIHFRVSLYMCDGWAVGCRCHLHFNSKRIEMLKWSTAQSTTFWFSNFIEMLEHLNSRTIRQSANITNDHGKMANFFCRCYQTSSMFAEKAIVSAIPFFISM